MTVLEESAYLGSGTNENRIPAGTEEAQLHRLEALAKEALQSGCGTHLQPEQVSSAEGRKEMKDACLKQIGVLGVLLEELRVLIRVPDLFFPQRLRQRAQALESELGKREAHVHSQLVSFASERETFASGVGQEDRDKGKVLKEPCLLYQNLTKDLALLETDADVAISALWKDMRLLRAETKSFAEVEAAHAAAAIRRSQAGHAPSQMPADKGEARKSGNAELVQAQGDAAVMERVLAEARQQAQQFDGAATCEECLGKVQHGLQQVRPRGEASSVALASSFKAIEGMDAEIQKVAQAVEVSKSQLQVGLVSEWEAIMGRTRDTAKWVGLLKTSAQHAETRFTQLNEDRRKLNQRLVHTKRGLDQFVNHAHLLRKNPSAQF